MSNFFLYHSDSIFDYKGAEAVFLKKGLSLPSRVKLGSWNLLLYPKILSLKPNAIQGSNGRFTFCIGTMCYRSLASNSSLERVHKDYFAGTLDHDELIGNFCLGFWDERVLSLMTDNLNLQHVFVNYTQRCLSSSFLALLASSPQALSLNLLAVHEKLASGYIVAPDTLVNGISQITYDLAPLLLQKTGIQFINKIPIDSQESLSHQGFQANLYACIEILKIYFKKIDAIACELKAELGISSGYDSRLLLALSQVLSYPIPLHSHHTLNVHESELMIARKLASFSGNQLTVIPTKRIEEYGEDKIREIILDNLYFFDGRCTNDIGHFSETYTPDYRKRVMKDNRLSLNGLGGECFRNSFKTPLGRFSWNDWQDYAVFFTFAKDSCGSNDSFLAMRGHRNKKIEIRLGIDLSGIVDSYTTRKYYGLVRMPDCIGNVCNAFNQVAYILTPFIEPSTLSEVLKVNSSIIGYDGEFEAAMINKISPKLSSIASQYGYSFSAIPRSSLVKAQIKSFIPLNLLVLRKRCLGYKSLKNSKLPVYQQVNAKNSCIHELKEVLRDVYPFTNWESVLCQENQKRTALYIASFIREFQHKLNY